MLTLKDDVLVDLRAGRDLGPIPATAFRPKGLHWTTHTRESGNRGDREWNTRGPPYIEDSISGAKHARVPFCSAMLLSSMFMLNSVPWYRISDLEMSDITLPIYGTSPILI